MTSAGDRAKAGFEKVRAILHADWDPIGCGVPLDEYDSYMLQAAGRLWNGASVEEVADYLVAVETEHMGLSDAPDVRPRARAAVTALNDYVAELRV